MVTLKDINDVVDLIKKSLEPIAKSIVVKDIKYTPTKVYITTCFTFQNKVNKNSIFLYF